VFNGKVTLTYAYKFTIYAEEPLYKANVYVDAANGTIIKEQNLICTINAVGSANTKYSGAQSLTADSYTAGYRLREAGRGLGIETYNMGNTSTYSSTDFTNASNSWTVTGANQAATDAHWGAEKTFDYYYQTFNRNSIDNSGYKLLSYVHYSNNYVNAFWDGLRMTYGDGDLSQDFSIMTALDVCGHEITHGVVENTAGLNGGEADALNEAFADIFGTSIEWYARPSQHDWIMGKDIMPSGTGIRNMSNPNALQQPDTYLGNYWDNTDEPHTNNGPCIYWFYLLSAGGSGTNDNSQAYNVSAITMAKASAIAYRAMTVYMTPSTDYANVRNYTIQAAKDLYGACSNEVIQTTNAWYAVGVGTQYTAGAIIPNFIANQVTSCSLPASINFNNTTAAGLSYKWSFGDGVVSTSTNPAHTYTTNGTYSVKLLANGCVAGSKDSVLKTSYITINAPLPATGSGSLICNGTSASLSANGNGIINWYNAASGGSLIATGNTLTTPNLNNSTTYYAVNTITQTPLFGGPTTNTVFGAGSNFNANTAHYQIFDVLQPCTLKTVKVVANSAGNRIIELRNASGTVLQTTTVSVSTGTQTINLNFPLTAGTDYQLAVGGTLVDLWRNNTGSGYPYNVGSLVSITASDVGTNFYYFFYNWQVQQADCQGNPVAITATVTTCTGINENVNESDVLLYPNPATDKLVVMIGEKMLSENVVVEIYDALGKLVHTKIINSLQTELTVNDLARGVYTCKLISSSSQSTVKRFIKE
jgi:Zn-dependent metalloprotease